MSSEVRTDTIFISHASADIEIATEIYERLKDRDYPVWMAVHEVKPGANYAEVILKTLNAAKAVIVLLSKDSIASDHVKREISLARELQLPIYPVTFADLAQLREIFGSDWKSWLDISKLSQGSSPREAARSLSRELNTVVDLSGGKEELDKKTRIWIDNASTLISTLLATPDSEFDFIGFTNELHFELGYQTEQLSSSLNKEGRTIVGEFFYSCYWTFTTLRPEWVPEDPRYQQMLKSNFLIPSAMEFYYPEGMNSIAYQLLESDTDLFVYWVTENYYFDDVLDRAHEVGARTPINPGDDLDSKKMSNTLGYLIFSTGLKLFSLFYAAKENPEKIDDAVNWMQDFDAVLNGKDLNYLAELCPTRSFAIWLPMVRLFSIFFEYKSGSIPNAERSLSMLSGSQQRDYQQFIYDQSQNTNLSEEYRNCWVEMESIIDELLGTGK
jgi:hypothetical protein